MFCPNCETENHDADRFCINCGTVLLVPSQTYRSGSGGELRGVGQRVFDNVPAEDIRGESPNESRSAENGSIDSEESFEAMLWPPETVFVPSVYELDDDPPIELIEQAESSFEDDQAEDIFYPEPEPLLIEEDGSGAMQPENAPIAETDVNGNVPETFVHENTEAEDDVDPESGADCVGLHAAEPRTKRRLLRTVAVFTIILAAFAAGVGAGAWFFAAPRQEPKVAEPAIASVEPQLEPPAIDTGAPQQELPPAGMAYIPGGEFEMGSNAGDVFSRPAHIVTVRPLFMDITEVTNEDYAKFVVAAGHAAPPGWLNENYPAGQDRLPVTGVSWFDAAAYAQWAGKRLPTEEEWEFAARGTDGRAYPWGNEWQPELANVGNASAGIRNVGEGGQSPFGLFDMAGNAWEWTASDAVAFPGGKGSPKSRLHLKIIRGGNWQSDERSAATYFRGYYGASGEHEYKGTSFRCVKDVTPN